MSDWPHAPIHRFGESGIYFITGATLHKQHIYRSTTALDSLQECLFTNASKHDCWLQAWSLFSNHYHLVVASDDGERLRRMLSRLHTEAAIDANSRDGTKGRKVWYQFRDKQLTFERSWLARLRYTHENAVHHGLVRDAVQYPWCSAGWFERTARRSFVETVRRMKIDRVNVYDDFQAAALLPL
jgi:putative transposase